MKSTYIIHKRRVSNLNHSIHDSTSTSRETKHKNPCDITKRKYYMAIIRNNQIAYENEMNMLNSVANINNNNNNSISSHSIVCNSQPMIYTQYKKEITKSLSQPKRRTEYFERPIMKRPVLKRTNSTIQLTSDYLNTKYDNKNNSLSLSKHNSTTNTNTIATKQLFQCVETIEESHFNSVKVIQKEKSGATRKELIDELDLDLSEMDLWVKASSSYNKSRNQYLFPDISSS